jgi:hypothetical protein
MPRAKKIFLRATLGTRAIGSSALVYSICEVGGYQKNRVFSKITPILMAPLSEKCIGHKIYV